MKKCFVAMIAVFLISIAAVAMAGHVAEVAGIDGSALSMRASANVDAGFAVLATSADYRVLVWRGSASDHLRTANAVLANAVFLELENLSEFVTVADRQRVPTNERGDRTMRHVPRARAVHRTLRT